MLHALSLVNMNATRMPFVEMVPNWPMYSAFRLISLLVKDNTQPTTRRRLNVWKTLKTLMEIPKMLFRVIDTFLRDSKARQACNQIKTKGMNLQYISDNKGKKTGVFIPIDDWKILQKHLSGLVELITRNQPRQRYWKALRMRLMK